MPLGGSCTQAHSAHLLCLLEHMTDGCNGFGCSSTTPCLHVMTAFISASDKRHMSLVFTNLVCTMEVFQILSIDIRWCDVCAATKPPLAGDTIPFFRFKVPSQADMPHLFVTSAQSTVLCNAAASQVYAQMQHYFIAICTQWCELLTSVLCIDHGQLSQLQASFEGMCNTVENTGVLEHDSLHKG